MAKRTRNPGEFCWINMITPQSQEARTFFAAMLGWTYGELPGMGHYIEVGGSRIGGLYDLSGPDMPPGTRPHIGVMVKVASADATAEKAISLGGSAKSAFDISDQGRMSMCTDPNGAAFDLWQPIKGQGTDVDSTLHGAPSWCESLTTDVDRGAAFYRDLFGWTSEDMPMPGMRYTIFKRGGESLAGMMAITPAMGLVPPHWSTYFTVRNTDELLAKAVPLGAKVVVEPQNVPGTGRFAGVISPQGVAFHVIQYIR